MRKTNKEIVIDELEELARTPRNIPEPWSDWEDAILKKYYKRVKAEKILPHLSPSRSLESVYKRARRMKLVGIEFEYQKKD